MKRALLFVSVLLVGTFAAYAQSTPLFILFPANSSDLTNVETEQAIENTKVFIEVARILSENPHQRILIDGHANPVKGTSQEENEVLRALSQRRAEIAADFLRRYYSIDARRIIVAGAGGVYSSGTDGHLNRRVNFIVIDPR